MAEIESTQENLISDFTSENVDAVVAEEKKTPVEDDATAPLIDIEPLEVEESKETLPSLTQQTTSGVEEVNCPDINEDTDEAIVDGFPAQTKPQMNGTAAAEPSLPTPTGHPEGFEELTTIDDKCNTDKKR